MITKATYIDALLAALPEFKATYEEHLADNNGERLDHPLFGELFRFTEAAHERGDSDLVGRVIAFMNDAANSDDPAMRELVHASFIEYLPNTALAENVVPFLGKAARSMYEAVINWKPEQAEIV